MIWSIVCAVKNPKDTSFLRCNVFDVFAEVMVAPLKVNEGDARPIGVRLARLLFVSFVLDRRRLGIMGGPALAIGMGAKSLDELVAAGGSCFFAVGASKKS